MVERSSEPLTYTVKQFLKNKRHQTKSFCWSRWI